MERTQQNRRTMPLPHPDPTPPVRPPTERSNGLHPREIPRVHRGGPTTPDASSEAAQ